MKHKSGNTTIYIIVIIALSLVVAGLGGLAIMLYIDNEELSTQQENRVNVAVAQAVLDTERAAEERFSERERATIREFVGPEDLGRLTFNYPRAWSHFIAQDGTNRSNYEAVFHPITVHGPILPNRIYALRVTIERQEYSSVLQRFDGLVRAGQLRSSVFQLGDIVGTRFDGSFSHDIRGSQVVMRVRNYTVIIRTDSETFLPYFNDIIQTIRLNL